MATTAESRTIPAVFGPLDMPHDRLPFEEMSRLYNFRRTSNWQALFARMLLDECLAAPKPVRALDIGCGHGIGRKPEWTAEIRRAVDELWGVEPDDSQRPPDGLFDNFQHALAETAVLPESYFDVAYSFMVVEHVADPVPYMSAISRCLKPGGVHIFLTVNGAHYFARCAKLVKSLRLEEAVLRLLRGRQEVEAYHYPVQYRLNTPRVIDRVASETGFDAPEYVFVEELGPEPYMRGPLRLAWHMLNWKRAVVKNPNVLLELYCRMRRAGGPSDPQ